MNELYICDTPYQIFNALNIAFHNNNEFTKKALYIIAQFKTAEEISSRIEKSGLFDEVYLLTRDETKFLKKGIKRNIYMAFDFLFPKIFLKKRFSNYPCKRMSYTGFDKVYASGAFSTVAAIMKLNRHADFVMFDDGLGSYRGNYIIRSSGGKFNRIFCTIFHVGSYVCVPSRLLVNNPEFCKSTVVEPSHIEKLPDLDNYFIDYCNKIYNVNKHNEFRYYWLTQPIDSNYSAKEMREKVRDSLEIYKEKIIVRLHPRDNDREFYASFTIEMSEDLWELSILNKDVDRLVLISEYSSAQMTPKMLFGFEPTLIFLYKLNRGYSEEQRCTMTKQIKDLMDSYNQPEKIYVPESISELNHILMNIL